MNKSKVIVLMSTFNGEAYLKEQIDSILSQVDIDVELLVRDDGSTDSTCEILNSFQLEYSNVSWFSGKNVGFINSFTQLIKAALKLYGKVDYYAFVDQDDRWLSNKLQRALMVLRQKDDNRPNLFTSNSTLIDNMGNNIGSFHSNEPIYRRGNILVYSTEQGCSMVFNRKAAELYCSAPPNYSWHDRWMYYICYYLGTVSYSHELLFEYRIHGNNTLAQSKRSIYNLTNNLNLILNKEESRHLMMAKEFYKSFGHLLSKDDESLFNIYLSYKYKFSSKLKLLFSKEYSCPYKSMKHKLIYYIKVMLNIV